MSRKTRRIIIPVVALVIVAAAAIIIVPRLLRSSRRSSFAGGTGTGESMIYDVKVQDVSTSTTVSGTINPARTATLTSQAAEKITAVYKKEGDMVRAGEVILRIDSSSQDNQVAQVGSRYRAAVISRKMAEMTDIIQTKVQLQSALTQALAGQLSAQINLRNFTDKDTSAQQVANLEGQVKQAQSNLQGAQNNLKSLQDYDTSAQQQTVSDLSVQQAQLNLNTAETRLVTLLTQQGPAATQSEIDSQVASIETSRLSLQNAKVNSQTTAATIGQKKLEIPAAQLQVDQAQISLEAAQNNLAATQKTTNALPNDLELLKSQLGEANSSVKVAQANLASIADTEAKNVLQLQSAKEQEYQALLTLNAQKLLSDNYVVKAPWNGVITALNVQVGDQLSGSTSQASGSTSVVVIADVSAWNVEAYIDEVDILHVKIGQDASMTIDPYSSQTLTGKVTYVGHTLVTTSSSVSAYAVKIQLTNPPTTLVAGMSCDASITVSVTKGVLAVPVESISSENNKKYVTMITTGADKKTTTTKTEVKTGIEGDEYVQITSGLNAGDRILRKASTTNSSSTPSTDTRGGFGGFQGGM